MKVIRQGCNPQLEQMYHCKYCDFMFCDTGIEYTATKEHLDYLEDTYGIEIIRSKAKKSIPSCVKTYGVPFWSKDISEKNILPSTAWV